MDEVTSPTITNRVHARVGFLGNPSDGFYGKTISFSLKNFYAEVTLRPSSAVSFVAHPVHDRQRFTSLADLCGKIETEGYYGGVRLLMAASKALCVFCSTRGITLQQKGFELGYDTNIPRQLGLSGSSAIVCAAVNCLMEYYGVDGSIPVELRPTLVLSAEEDLGITAGLQDRVIQVYGGLVLMDFEEGLMKAERRGRYTPLDPSLLAPLWLMYCREASDSGRVHSDVKRRWLEGDPVVREAMEKVAEVAVEGRGALERGDVPALAALMDRNFDLRRSMFGDEALGRDNLRMVAVARSVGAAGKLTGSGGAVLVLCPGGAPQEAALQEACKEEGFALLRVEVGPALHTTPAL